MSVLITSVVLVLIGIGAFVYLRQANRRRLAALGAIPVVLAALVFLSNCFTQVRAKELAVKVSFGRPVGELGAGLHLKWPWQSVTKIDETIFTDTYGGKTGIPVRLGDGNTATVNATIRWHVDPTAAEYIYANYRSNDPAENLRDAVVDTQFKAAVNQVLAGFNPTEGIASAKDLLDNSAKLNFSPNYAELGQETTTSMQSRVRDASGTSLVVLDGITVAGVSYSQATEDRINSIVAQVAKTQQAVQSEATAQAQAKANRILEASLKNDPYVLVSKCLDDLANGSFTPPAGFSCWPSGSGAVVVPGTK
jgi:regulator of protease activity HflC (stomatin/prohibitin superfamily)